MRFRTAPPAALVAAALVVLASCTGGGSKGPTAPRTSATFGSAAAIPSRANIVLILTDDQRFDSVDLMPTVRKELVDEGVTFDQAVVVNPVCCPSRASILTGQYSHTTGVYTNTRGHGGFDSFHPTSTIATWLQDAGYRTALIGKYLNGYDSEYATYVPPGWDEWFAALGQTYFDYEMSDNGTVRSFGSEPRAYSTDVLARKAVRFIATTPADQPLFLYFAPHAPHLPAVPAPGDADAFSHRKGARPPDYDEADVSDKPAWVRRIPRLDPEHRRRIDARARSMLATLPAVDRAVAGIVQALRESGRLRDTLIVLTSDNGYLWGEHRLSDKNAPYEESIRVPLVMRYDAFSSEHHVDHHLVANLDLAPTFAQAAGVEAPGAEGVSLLPLLALEGERWRQDLLIEHVRAEDEVPTFCAVRSATHMYVVYDTAEEELYDLAADPYELDNRAADSAVASTKAAMLARLAELCDPPPPGLTLP